MSPEGAQSWSIVAQQELFGGWRRWVSFALIWIWSCVAGTLSLQPYVVEAMPSLFSFGNSIVLLFCVIALACVLSQCRRLGTACGNVPYITLGSAFLVCGSLLLLGSVLTQSYGLYFAGAACGGISIGVLKVAWGEMYANMPLKASMVSMGYALVASSVCVLLANRAPAALLGGLLVAVSLPLGPCLYTGAQSLGQPEDQTRRTGPVRILSWFLPVPALVGLSYGVFKVGAPLAPQGGILVFDIQTAGLWGNLMAGVAFLAVSRFLGQSVTPARIIVADMIVVVAGLLMLAAPHVSIGLANLVHELGFSLFYFFMIVYWGDLARRMHTPVIFTYTTGYLAMMASQLVGGTLSEATGGPFVTEGDMTLAYVLVFAFVLSIAFISGSSPEARRRSTASDQGEQGTSVHLAMVCERLADMHALTPREREVLTVLARGRNAAHIAEELVISQDTAKSHIKNIYRKLDVHTQQELLDLVEG